MLKSLNLKGFANADTFNIVYDAEQKPAAVLVPIAHWHPAKAAELEQLMEQLTYIPVFECSLKELEERLRPEIEQVEAQNLDAGLYNIQELAGKSGKNHVIRQYADHRELIKIDPDTGNSQIISRKF
jgi:hypothetical protein